MPPSYEVTWQPAPGVLFSLPETAGGVSFAISCLITASPPIDELPEPKAEVVGYMAAVDKPQSALSIASGSGGVTVSAPALTGLFGIEFIDYQKDRVTTRIYRWDDLPADADEIIEFTPSTEQSRQYVLTVTALLSNGGEAVANYAMIINQDWTAGRDRLLGEMNVRNNRIR